MNNTHKQTAINFLHQCAAGDIRQAFRKYVGEGFKHHNIYFKGDADTLITAMEENAKQMPDKTFEIKQALQDGASVAILSHVRQNANAPGFAIVHILRFENDKITEMWDYNQPVPAETINENGMF